jgi:hypothetical protein
LERFSREFPDRKSWPVVLWTVVYPIISRSSLRGGLAYGQKFRQEKTKHQRAKAPWWNACPVAMKVRGNRIGSITDLKTSCIAAGRPDLAYKLVEQLQNALDSLKHRVEIDESVVSEIRKEVAPAPWLLHKRERRVSDLPAQLEIADTDKVGRLYKLLRKELGLSLRREPMKWGDRSKSPR